MKKIMIWILALFLLVFPVFAADVTDTGQTVLPSSGSSTDPFLGLLFEPNSNVCVKSVTRVNGVTGSYAIIVNHDTANELGRCTSWSSDICTFTTPIPVTSGSTYRVLVGNNGSSYTRYFESPSDPSFPFNGVNVDFTAGCSMGGGWTLAQGCEGGATNSVYYNVEAITTGDCPASGPPVSVNVSEFVPADGFSDNTLVLNTNFTMNNSESVTCRFYNLTTELYNITDIPAGNNNFVSFNISYPALTEKNFSYYITCYDTNYTRNSSVFTYNIDTVFPTFTSSLDSNNTNWTNSITLNVNASDTNLYLVNYSDDCGSSYSNYSLSSSEVLTSVFDITSCSIGWKNASITVCDGYTSSINCVTRNYLFLTRGGLRIRVFNAGSQLSNFSVYKDESYDGFTSIGYYDVQDLNPGTYNISVDPIGYQIKDALIDITGSYLEYNFSVYETNTINFTFYDEDTLAIISEKIQVDLISDSFANNYSVSNGSLFASLLIPDAYTIRYGNGNYTERFYFFNLFNRSYNNFNLYLNKNTTSQVTVTIIDEVGNNIENAFVKVMKYNIETNTYDITEIIKTDVDGQGKVSLDLNNEFYKFTVEYPLGSIQTVTSPSYITSTSLTIQINLGSVAGDQFFNTQGIDYSLTFNDVTNNFNFFYNDPNNVITGGCLDIYTVSARGNTLYNSSCSDSSTSTILINVQALNGTLYEAQGFAYYENWNDQRLLATLSHSWSQSSSMGDLGIFLIFILVIVFASVGYWSKSVALIIAPLPLFFGTIIVPEFFQVWWAIGIEIISIIVAVVIGDKYG